jgi:hypothetical protein
MSALVAESGYFWWHTEEVPDGRKLPECHSFGTISISEEGLASLELTDNQLERRNRGSDQHTFAAGDSGNKHLIGKSIQGYLRDSDQYVLIHDLYSQGDQSFIANSSILKPKARFQAGVVPQYIKMRIRLAGLDQWLGLGSIQADVSDTRANFKYKKPENKVFALEQGTIAFEYGFSGSWKRVRFDRYHKVVFAETVDLVFEPPIEMSLNDIRDRHRVFECLFALFTSPTLLLEWPYVAAKDDDEFSRFYFNTSKRPELEIKMRECVVLFDDLKGRVGEISSTWLSKWELFGAGFFLYFAASREGTMFTAHKFVTLIWGLEAFDRVKFSRDQVVQESSDKLQRTLAVITDAAEKKWLKGYKHLLTQPSLEARLLRVLQSLGIFQNNEKLKIFAKSCADRRNDLSHFGGPRTGNEDSDFTDNLDQKCTALLYLFRALILHEIGVDASLLNRWLFEGSTSFLIKRAFSDAGLGD